MKPHAFLIFALLGGLSPLHAASISLASTMDGSSYMAQYPATGSFARINLGDGTVNDRDGLYRWNGTADPAIIVTGGGAGQDGEILGGGINLFPREANFQVGSVTYNENLVSPTGISTVPITTIDLGAFWTADPARTTAPFLPTVISDISDQAIGFWFFNMAGGIGFGALDANDTLTFTDGVLTSIDLELTTSFSAYGGAFTWNGVFSITGNEIAYQIDQTLGGSQRFVADLTGTVNSVIPEPSALLLSALGSLALLRRKRA